MVKTRSLGLASRPISTVGFGAWGIGGDGRGSGPSDSIAINTVRRAIELGVNWIDTAAVYGLGRSEELVGRAMASWTEQDRPLVCTKGGIVWSDDYPPRMRRCLRPDSIRQQCEASLRRLGVGSIDLYQFHWPDEEGTAVEDSWAELETLIDEGKVRAAGLSNFPIALMERCQARRPIDAVQARLSLVSRQSTAELIPWCANRSIGVIAYSPMEGGLLTATGPGISAGRFASWDWRSRWPQFEPPRLERNLELVRGLERIATELGSTVAALAVAWAASQPGVTGVVAGARSPEQVDDWVAGSVLSIGTAMDEIDTLLRRTAAGGGPLSNHGDGNSAEPNGDGC